MSFAAPWVLLALAGLPLLYWLLRVVPPAPRQLSFPAVRLLLALPVTSQTAARTPPWLLALRLAAAGLIVLGLARPVLRGGGALPGSGPLLLVIDDGWEAAPDWPARLRAAEAVLLRAADAGRGVSLLATARDGAAGADAGPRPTATMPAAELAPILAVLRPKPWPVDRRRAAQAVRDGGDGGGHGVAYVADGTTGGDGWTEFAAALRAVGPILTLAADTPPASLLLPASAPADGLLVRVAQVARAATRRLDVLAQAADGRTLAKLPIVIAANDAVGEATLRLPTELRNQIDRLAVAPDGALGAGAGGVLLLDEASRRRPVGVLAGDTAADTPLTGAAFYLRRALDPYAEIREADLDTLLARPLSVLILADHPLSPGPEAERLRRWVEQGGLLLRFAGPASAQGSASAQSAPGPDTADSADPLLPVPLLAFQRELGGAMSWGAPVTLAPFTPPSPFAGLPVADEIRVTRQVLADPAGDLTAATWARLADGTPLVTQRPIGAGRVVLVHVTANTDWSSLPLSGLFVDMLRRLVALSAGVAGEAGGAAAAPLAPAAALDGEGVLGSPPATASAIPPGEFATIAVSASHPPGLYGPETGRRALNLSANLKLPEAAPPLPGAARERVGEAASEVPLGPWLLALAVALLAVDLLASLWLRGLLPARIATAAMLLASLAIHPSRAAEQNKTEQSKTEQSKTEQNKTEQSAALATRLAHVVTGDAALDEIAQSGLAGLSAYVNARTAAMLAEPTAVTPGRDDLSFYPLLYWPLSADAALPEPDAIAALNDYTTHGGIVLIDTRDGGSGAGMAPGAGEVLRRLASGGGGALVVPPLAALTAQHVLARAFYLLGEFPGRYAGDAVWVGRDQDRSNDSVSPVIVGGHDWAAAWVTDADGRHPYATLPGGERQRTLAFRFGVNLVMYALTGNYKGDQVHVPALLERLGQ